MLLTRTDGPLFPAAAVVAIVLVKQLRPKGRIFSQQYEVYEVSIVDTLWWR
jgi:hypothetical protein